ncbi:hypothetical protein [Spirosoma aerolatum]|uniref:hypothetical protein n=1 Tax=Spirosoma aerolatum TaxID=1211326 RepID=UPI0009ABCEDD|nr:hypothetical protein [Spirosoma aerolatum]
MSFSDAEIRESIRNLAPDVPIQVWPAIVKSIQGTNCTVDILGTDLEDVTDVNLRADDEATEGVLLIPRVGSFVYVGAVNNSVDSLYVCMVSEVDSVQVKMGNTVVTVDQDQVHAVRDSCELLLSTLATLKQGQTEVTLDSGKVSIKNAGVSLKDVFSDLISLLQNFQVVCATAGAPSASVFPATLALITSLNAKINQLLQ